MQEGAAGDQRGPQGHPAPYSPLTVMPLEHYDRDHGSLCHCTMQPANTASALVRCKRSAAGRVGGMPPVPSAEGPAAATPCPTGTSGRVCVGSSPDPAPRGSHNTVTTPSSCPPMGGGQQPSPACSHHNHRGARSAGTCRHLPCTRKTWGCASRSSGGLPSPPLGLCPGRRCAGGHCAGGARGVRQQRASGSPQKPPGGQRRVAWCGVVVCSGMGSVPGGWRRLVLLAGPGCLPPHDDAQLRTCW